MCAAANINKKSDHSALNAVTLSAAARVQRSDTASMLRHMDLSYLVICSCCSKSVLRASTVGSVLTDFIS